MPNSSIPVGMGFEISKARSPRSGLAAGALAMTTATTVAPRKVGDGAGLVVERFTCGPPSKAGTGPLPIGERGKPPAGVAAVSGIRSSVRWGNGGARRKRCRDLRPRGASRRATAGYHGGCAGRAQLVTRARRWSCGTVRSGPPGSANQPDGPDHTPYKNYAAWLSRSLPPSLGPPKGLRAAQPPISPVPARPPSPWSHSSSSWSTCS